jgi:hypothetical protein
MRFVDLKMTLINGFKMREMAGSKKSREKFLVLRQKIRHLRGPDRDVSSK